MRATAGPHARSISPQSYLFSTSPSPRKRLYLKLLIIMHTNPSLTLTTDASNTGWGAVCRGQQTGGLWSTKKHCFHINYLEMKVVLFGLQSLCSDLTDKHIRIQSDNTSTVSYINAMGGIKSTDCNDMALQIWQWANGRNIWLSSCHLPGVNNVVADKESRHFDG